MRLHTTPSEAVEELQEPHGSGIWRTLKKILLIIFVIVLAGGGWLGWKLYSDAAKITGQRNPFALLSLFMPVELKQTDGRTNTLLAGYSVGDPGHDGAELTDSIMIISVNKATKSAVVISIPRDLYVNIPGHGYSKINATYEYGETDHFSEPGYAPGGMGLLQKVVEQNLGIHSNYYGLINYDAFKSAVNTVGGVSININSSDKRGIYDSNTNIKLPNGNVTLDGQKALDLARSRGDGYYTYGLAAGDFDRTKYQQELLVALKDKASSSKVLANPLKIAGLADSAGKNVKTDMKLNELETFYSLVKKIDDSNIRTVTLNQVNKKNLLQNYTTRDGQAALVPAAGIDDFSAIQAALDSLLSQ